MLLASILFMPAAAAGLVLMFKSRRAASSFALGAGIMEVLALALAVWRISRTSSLELGKYLRADSLTAFFLVNLGAVFFLVLLYSTSYIRHIPAGRFSSPRWFYSLLFLFLFSIIAVYLAGNLGFLWIMMEATTLASALLVGFYNTEGAVEAGWKYLIVCTVGLAFALFGTIVFYVAAVHAGLQPEMALQWYALAHAGKMLANSPALLKLGFIFLLVGYGTKIGLVPMHSWLPDAHAEGPTPISAVLSGLLLNVALYAVVRSKVLVDGALERNFSGDLLMGFGLLSVVVAAFFLSRQKDIKRMFAYSSVEHMGFMTFAFGMGGPVAAFAGLLHMTVHSLTKSAIFFTVGHASQATGTQTMDSIRGLIQQSPTIGWGLALGSLAILGMPPFGVFTSEFMVLTTAMHEHAWATPFLLVALGVAFAAIFGKVQPMVFGESVAARLPHPPALVPVFVHLAIVLLLGLYIPPYLVGWYRHAAALIG